MKVICSAQRAGFSGLTDFKFFPAPCYVTRGSEATENAVWQEFFEEKFAEFGDEPKEERKIIVQCLSSYTPTPIETFIEPTIANFYLVTMFRCATTSTNKTSIRKITNTFTTHRC